MIKLLLLSVCKEDLHNLEFVNPLIEIIKNFKLSFEVKNYKEKINFENYTHVIICGTSLRDNEFLENINNFLWIKEFKGKILGICAGMEIIGLVFGGSFFLKTEIGFYFENFEKNFLGLFEKVQVYHLHNNYVTFDDNFYIFSKNADICQAVKHKEREIYGCLFHPEVRNQEVIRSFING